VIGKQDAYFVRHHSDSLCRYFEADIKSMLGFLVDNTYVAFGDKPSNNPLAFLWALIVLIYWQIYSYIHIRQNLFRNCYGIKTKN
jgi:hypothetical protein